MTKRNITVQLDVHHVELAKVLAAQRGTSVSALLARQIEEMTTADARYEHAKQRAMAALDEAVDRGGRDWSREELYDRANVR